MAQILRKHWWKILIAIITAAFIGLVAFLFVKAKPAYDFIKENFTSEQSDDKKLSTEPFIMYISAIDNRDGELPEKSRSDLNILAVVNPKNKKVMLVNIPRDYYVNLPEINQMDKLTHAGEVGGVELSKKTIEQLLDIKIDRYIRVNFSALSRVVDAIDGIDIYSDQANSYNCYWDKNCVINPGTNHLDGNCAVAFSRERLSYKEGDLKRAENQEKVLTAIFDKIGKNKTYIYNYEKILAGLSGTFDSDLNAKEVLQFASLVTTDWQITEKNLGVAGSGLEYTYTFPSEQKFVFYQNEDSINEIHNLTIDALK